MIGIFDSIIELTLPSLEECCNCYRITASTTCAFHSCHLSRVSEIITSCKWSWYTTHACEKIWTVPNRVRWCCEYVCVWLCVCVCVCVWQREREKLLFKAHHRRRLFAPQLTFKTIREYKIFPFQKFCKQVQSTFFWGTSYTVHVKTEILTKNCLSHMPTPYSSNRPRQHGRPIQHISLHNF